MPNYQRVYQSGGTYFFTVVTFERRPVFNTKEYTSLLMQCFEHTIQSHPFVIDALVILPDHLHTIWTLPETDYDFSNRWNQIKGNFTRRYHRLRSGDVSESSLRRREKEIWQRRFWEHLIRDQKDFNRHCDYIHYNPVKHRLAVSPSTWQNSTSKKYVEQGHYTDDWGSGVDEQLMEMDLE